MGRRGLASAMAAALCAASLHACAPEQDLPETGLVHLLGAAGLHGATFRGREYGTQGVSLTSVTGRLPVAGGYVLSASEVQGAKVERTKPVGWQAESIVLSGVTLTAPGRPEEPLATAGDLAVDPVRTETAGTAWRGLRASQLAFIDGDGNPGLSTERLVARWNPVGGDGTLRLALVAERVEARPSWLAGLGAGPCLVGALTGKGPLNFQVALRYRPADGAVTVESATLSGAAGAVGLTLVLDGVPQAFVTPGHVAEALLDPELVPDAIRFKGLALDYRDAGAVAECLAAVPGYAAADPAGAAAIVSGMPALTEERDRQGLAAALAGFAAAPDRLQLWLNPVDAIALRYVPSAMTSPARSRYLSATLAVNDGVPVSTLGPEGSPAAVEAVSPEIAEGSAGPAKAAADASATSGTGQ